MEMCTQGMVWDLLYILQMSKSWTFEELATKAHDMEVIIANCRETSFGFAELKDKVEFKRNVEFSKSYTKEAMSVFKVEPGQITGKWRREEKKSTPFKDVTSRRPTLKEL